MCENPARRSLYDDIAEVATVGSPARANALLAGGWRLLNIQGISEAKAKRDGQEFVARRPCYILGRPAGVPVTEPNARLAS